MFLPHSFRNPGVIRISSPSAGVPYVSHMPVWLFSEFTDFFPPPCWERRCGHCPVMDWRPIRAVFPLCAQSSQDLTRRKRLLKMSERLAFTSQWVVRLFKILKSDTSDTYLMSLSSLVPPSVLLLPTCHKYPQYPTVYSVELSQ